MQNCIARVFDGVNLMCMCSGGKWAPHFGLQIQNTVTLRHLKHYPHGVRAVVVLSSQAWQAFTYCSTKCNSLCKEDLQRYIFHRWRQAVWSDNKQRGVRRREVIKTCSHIIIPTPSPSLRLFFFPLQLSPFCSPSLSQMKRPSQAAWQMKMMERLIKKKGGEKNEKWFWSGLPH